MTHSNKCQSAVVHRIRNMKLWIFISFVIICTTVAARYEDIYVSPADSETTKAVLLSTSTNVGRSFSSEGYKYPIPNSGNNIVTHRNNKNNKHTPSFDDGNFNSPQNNYGNSIESDGYFYSRNSTPMDFDGRTSNESYDLLTSHYNNFTDSQENLNDFGRPSKSYNTDDSSNRGYNNNAGYRNSEKNTSIRNGNANNNYLSNLGLNKNSEKRSKLRNSGNFLNQEYRAPNQGYNTNNNNIPENNTPVRTNKENNNYLSNIRLNNNSERKNKLISNSGNLINDEYDSSNQGFNNGAYFNPENNIPVRTNNKNNNYLSNVESTKSSEEQNRFSSSENFLNQEYSVSNQGYNNGVRRNPENNIPVRTNNKNNNYLSNVDSNNNSEGQHRLRNSVNFLKQEYGIRGTDLNPETNHLKQPIAHTNSRNKNYKTIPNHVDSYVRHDKNTFADSISQDYDRPNNHNGASHNQKNNKLVNFRVLPNSRPALENFNTFNQKYDENNNNIVRRNPNNNNDNNNKYLPPPYVDDISKPRETDTSTDINHGYDTINPNSNNIPLSPPADTNTDDYNYENGRQHKQIHRELKNEMHTSYFFTADNGQYNNGNDFQEAHLPNPPSISDAILNSWEKEATEEFQEICTENEINCSTDA